MASAGDKLTEAEADGISRRRLLTVAAAGTSEGVPFRLGHSSVAGTPTNHTGIFEGKTAVVRPGLLGRDAKQTPLDQQILSFP